MQLLQSMSVVWAILLITGLGACDVSNGKNGQRLVQGRSIMLPVLIKPIDTGTYKKKQKLGLTKRASEKLKPAFSKYSLNKNLLIDQKIEQQIYIGLLLPLSGSNASVGQSLLRAAQIAFFEVPNHNLVLLPRDTKGTPKGAREAALSALEAGATLLLGPVYSSSVLSVAPIAASASVNMIAFSNDRAAVRKGGFILGFLPKDRIERVVSFAASKGFRKFAALIPRGRFGDRVALDFAASVKKSGGLVVRSARYGSNRSSILAAVKFLSEYYHQKGSNLKTSDVFSKKQDILKSRNSLHGVPFEAVFLPETGDTLQAIAPLLPHFGIDIRKIRLLGINDWSVMPFKREPSLAGAWFVVPSRKYRDIFFKQFKRMFGLQPHPLSVLVYDSVSLAALKANQLRDAFSIKMLTQPEGFLGTAGLFRLRRDGLAEHKYSVMELNPKEIRIISLAPKLFFKKN